MRLREIDWGQVTMNVGAVILFVPVGIVVVWGLGWLVVAAPAVLMIGPLPVPDGAWAHLGAVGYGLALLGIGWVIERVDW